MVRCSRRRSCDQLVDFEAHLRVEAGGRLVEKQHLRIVEQRQREREALLLAAGELAVERVALLPELQALEQRVAVDRLRVEAREEIACASRTLIFSGRLVACRQTPIDP